MALLIHGFSCQYLKNDLQGLAAVQWTNVRGTGLSPDGINISYAAWCGLKKKKLPSVLVSFTLGSYHVIGNC